MSVTLCVFLRDERMLDPGRWAKAIQSSGFDMELDSELDVRSFSGFLPCTYGGQRAGFEYFWENVADQEFDENVLAQIGDRDVVISFNTHADLRGLMTSTIASAVLCAQVDGVAWDTEANELISAADAMRWAREMEAAIRADL